MAKNLTNFEDFQNKRKSVTEKKVDNIENVEKIDEAQSQKEVDSIPIVKMVNFPIALVKSFIKKVSDETGKDIVKGGVWSDDLIARTLVDYTISNLMIIENFPVSIVTGNADKSQAQIAQAPAQTAQQVPQAQVPAPQEGGQQIQSPPATVGTQNPQQTAQQIPPTE
jgi:hypothetical protein